MGLVLPPLPFPTRFDDSVDGPSSAEQARPVPWPDASDEIRRDSAPVWGRELSTESEHYIAKLESRLGKLNGPPPGQHPKPSTSKDSGYGSRVTMSPDGYTDEHAGERDEPALAFDRDSERLEGRPLLADADDEHTEDEDHESTAVLVTPATPHKGQNSHDQGSSAEDDQGQLGLGHADEQGAGARRISFSGRVRISGGIRATSRPHRHSHWPPTAVDALPTTEEEGQSGSRQSRSARNPSVTSLSRQSSRSRTSSPARSTPNSSDINVRTLSSLVPSVPPRDAYSLYSSSPTSQVPSRSSSPCSSIYAPLQAPKAHCPSPMFVQPAAKRKPSALSLSDVMLGRTTGEYAGRNYRELVEEQRLRRERRERWRHRRNIKYVDDEELEEGDAVEDYSDGGHDTDSSDSDLERARRRRLRKKRKKQKRHFWTRVAELLALGAAGPGPRATFASYGSTAHSGLMSDVSSRPRSSRLRVSADSGTDSSDEDERGQPSNQRSRARLVRDKTEADVRFGRAPARWLSPSWWMWKLGQAAGRLCAWDDTTRSERDEYDSL